MRAPVLIGWFYAIGTIPRLIFVFHKPGKHAHCEGGEEGRRGGRIIRVQVRIVARYQLRIREP